MGLFAHHTEVKAMADRNPLSQLIDYGQSFWLDFIRRGFIETGELKTMIDNDGLRGITSNPSIFEKAIAGSTDYRKQLDELRCEPGLQPQQMFERLAVKDIQAAADLLRPVYDSSGKGDGFISLEVSPGLANDTDGTVKEARELWKAVDRPNLMVKVPGTRAGVPAFETLISEGININVTLLFAVEAYENVAAAYIRGLEKRAGEGKPVDSIASVASFFVSRIDTAVDALLKQKAEAASGEDRAHIESLYGKTAIANAKRAYQRFKTAFSGSRWEALAQRGAKPQRVLWASTSTKNPAYRDVVYIEELIGPHTVNTMPPTTAEQFREHGRLRNALEEHPEAADALLAEISRIGIDLKEVTAKLTVDGVRQFTDAYDKMLEAIRESVKPLAKQTAHLPAALQKKVDEIAAEWEQGAKTKRIWDGDASLWTGADESKWLGWLRIADEQVSHIEHLVHFRDDVKKEGFAHAVVLGMGGSSLAPEVLSRTFGRQEGFPELEILDSTDPGQIRALESRLDLKKTLFIVSSKSGSTLEPNLYYEYFRSRVDAAVGRDQAGRQFVAVTDPGSAMEKVAKEHGFREIFHGVASIGGRYSALSDFGMAPAAAMGLDVARLLDRAETMAHSCASCVPVRENPGFALGSILGALGRQGRDKVTIVASPAIADFGAWLEQLIAESTGKIGRGLIPVDQEPLGTPEVYGDDRLFAYLRFTAKPDAKQDEALQALAAAGQPVVQIDIADPYDIGMEFFRWEFATAVAGSVLGINPFDQPDVEASKVATRQLTSEYEKTGKLPAQQPLASDDGISIFASDSSLAAGKGSTVADVLTALFERIGPGDYVAFLAYITRNDENAGMITGMRQAVRDDRHVATCGGFGPRFLHSTGQAYKGGPNSGVFVQITCDEAEDLAVPGHEYTFGVVKTAQALGDLQVLVDRGRRAVRVHLPKDVKPALAKLEELVRQALKAGEAVRA
jgi:transaldolase/glucose-6-phosphate isomerase